MIVFERDRPLRGEAEFDAGSNHAAPTGLTCLRERAPRSNAKSSSDGSYGGVRYPGIFVVGKGRAALQICEHVVPGIADLAGEETDGIDFGLVDEGHTAEGANRAGVGSLQISPVALGF